MDSVRFSSLGNKSELRTYFPTADPIFFLVYRSLTLLHMMSIDFVVNIESRVKIQYLAICFKANGIADGSSLCKFLDASESLNTSPIPLITTALLLDRFRSTRWLAEAMAACQSKFSVGGSPVRSCVPISSALDPVASETTGSGCEIGKRAEEMEFECIDATKRAVKSSTSPSSSLDDMSSSPHNTSLLCFLRLFNLLI